MIRAKFNCYEKSLTKTSYYDSKEGKTVQGILTRIKFQVVTGGSKENDAFYASTPQGSIEVGVVREEVANMFKLGENYYVDFTPELITEQ